MAIVAEHLRYNMIRSESGTVDLTSVSCVSRYSAGQLRVGRDSAAFIPHACKGSEGPVLR